MSNVVEFNKRFISISELKDGWGDGSGIKYDTTFLNWLRTNVVSHFAKKSLPLPSVDPSEFGGIYLQWEFSLSLFIELYITEDKMCEMTYSNEDSDYNPSKCDELLDLSKIESWSKLETYVATFDEYEI